MTTLLDAPLQDVCDGVEVAFALRARLLLDPYRTEDEEDEIAVLDVLLEEWWDELRRRTALGNAIRQLLRGQELIG